MNRHRFLWTVFAVPFIAARASNIAGACLHLRWPRPVSESR